MQMDIDSILGVRARRTDPESSAAADTYHRASGKRERNLDRALRLIARHPGSTTRELATLDKWCRYELARRCADLKRIGLATHSPRPRECQAGGRQAVAWILTQQGQTAVLKLPA